MGLGLTTDLYELTMAAVYLRREMRAPATFSLFVRRTPTSRGFLVTAGLSDCLNFLSSFRFQREDLDYISRVLGFDDTVVERLAGLRFTGSVRAAPEGRVMFAGEPLLEVTAPLPEAQLVETALLNHVTFQTNVATKALRCVHAADGAELVDFSFRRTQGIETGASVARACAIAGFAGTSNTEAARRYGIPAVGTMAHSFIEAFPGEEEAFASFVAEFPDRATFLVDTYDTMSGVRAAIRVAERTGLADRFGIRLDSGDLAELSKAARAELDAAGLPHARIFASGGLDEYAIERLTEAGAPIDAYGVGTKVGVSGDAPYLDSAYKLVEFDGTPVMKLSTGKVFPPGAKQVFRGPDRDLLGLRDEAAPAGWEPLLREVTLDGEPVPANEEITAARDRLRADLAWLPPAARTLRTPDTVPVEWSEPLRRQYARVRERLSRQGDT